MECYTSLCVSENIPGTSFVVENLCAMETHIELRSCKRDC
jgi:hypothetical protein